MQIEASRSRREGCIVLAVVLLFIFLFQRASDVQTMQVDWIYIVPDNYTGFLAIQYECPNGQPLMNVEGKIRVEYDDAGVFCTSDPSAPWMGKGAAQSRSGDSISIWPEQGYGLCCGFSMSIAGGPNDPEYSVEVQWVGDRDARDAIPSTSPLAQTPAYSLDAFLEDRFGIPDH